ncbi:MAG TPA: PIN domain-containing protein [Thermoanaerobaculia bacterium]|nr:PIN domain-containing protein [Thermoanaerobaculia bacterium]
MILIDTGPLVALFDPRDGQHRRCREALRDLNAPLYTTVPVLVETFHMLSPGSLGASRLRDFLRKRGVWVWFMTEPDMGRALDLMDRYADHPMDLADASLVVAAEALEARRIFTLDRDDFSTYRVSRGHYQVALEIVP